MVHLCLQALADSFCGDGIQVGIPQNVVYDVRVLSLSFGRHYLMSVLDLGRNGAVLRFSSDMSRGVDSLAQVAGGWMDE